MMLLAVVSVLMLRPLLAHAQYQNQDVCASQYVEDAGLPEDVEQTVCLTYDTVDGLEPYVETDNDYYENYYAEYGDTNLWTYGVAAEAKLIGYDVNDNATTVADTGMQYSNTDDSGSQWIGATIANTPQQYPTYVLSGYYQVCESGDYPLDPCEWQTYPYGSSGLGISVAMHFGAFPTPTLSISTSGTPAQIGAPVTFTATIGASGLDGENMDFSDPNIGYIGSGTIYGTTATFTTSTLPAGTYSISASYYGDLNYNSATSNPIAQVVANISGPTPTLSLSTSGTPSAGGQPVTFTATISFDATGENVGFYANGGYLGSGTFSSTTATFTTSTLSQGTYSVSANYNGDQNYAPATSASINQTVTSPPIYSYTITPSGGASGYAANGNLLSYADSVNGTWNMSQIGMSAYDSLNRLTIAKNMNTLQSYCWTYDDFGNRTAYVTESGDYPCPVPSYISPTVSYNASNQVTWVQNSAPVGFGYDGAGDVTSDGLNQYLYDAEGRVCAVEQSVAGVVGYTGYIYDAEGNRVAKGTLNSLSCDMGSNGFQQKSWEILGQNGEQVSETDGAGNWAHTNVYAGVLSLAKIPSGRTPA